MRIKDKRRYSVTIQTIIIVGFCIIMYELFLITTSAYKDYKLTKYFKESKKENNILKDKNLNSKKDLLYFSSPQFRDKYAKQNLGKLKTGEKIIVFSEVKANIFYDNYEEKKYERDITALPKTDQWYIYFFGDESLYNFY